MPSVNSTPEDTTPDDRKSAIEAAFEQHEAPPEDPPVKETTPEVSQETPEEAATENPKEPGEEKEPPAEEPAPAEKVDRAPQSWKPIARAAWDKIDPIARAEIMRRENQTTRVLDESANARRFAEEFQKVTQPFSARLQALNAHPLAVYQELLKADHLLSTGSKTERATLVAKLVKDYDVDIEALDNALAGRVSQEAQAAPQAQIDAQVERLLEQRLAPFKTLLEREQQREQQTNQVVATTIQQMAANHEKYPYFHDVREDMADLLELAARKGRTLTLDEAYNQATLLDPDISKLVQTRTQATQAAQSATKANALAQRAKRASVSVGGAPSGLVSGSPAAGDRRAAIEAAFDAASGR